MLNGKFYFIDGKTLEYRIQNEHTRTHICFFFVMSLHIFVTKCKVEWSGSNKLNKIISLQQFRFDWLVSLSSINEIYIFGSGNMLNKNLSKYTKWNRKLESLGN